MRVTLRTACLLLTSVVLPSLCYAKALGSEFEKPYGQPEQFEEAIRAFEKTDEINFPPTGAIVCIGSSSIRGWHSTITDDLAPLSIIPRGFGGSNMNDALHYTDRIVFPYKPRAVIVYEGDNDIAQGMAPEKIKDTFRGFVRKVHEELPECRIYFLSIKPSISRWPLWPKMKEANSLIAAECAKDKRLTFVDVASGMLDDDGNPRKEIFKEDNLHMTSGGYVIWRNALKPILLEGELQFEPRKDLGKP